MKRKSNEPKENTTKKQKLEGSLSEENHREVEQKVVPEEIVQNNKKIVLENVQKDGLALQYASPDLKNDPDVVKASIHNNELAFKYASVTLQKEIVLEKPNFLKYASKDCVLSVLKMFDCYIFSRDYFALKNLRFEDQLLQFVSNKLQKDREVVLKAIYLNPEEFDFAHPELQNDQDFIREAVETNPEVIEYCDSRLLDKDIVLSAGEYLTWIPDGFENDRDVVLLAIKNEICNVEFLTDEFLIQDKNFLMQVVQADCGVFDALSGLSDVEIHKDDKLIQFVANKIELPPIGLQIQLQNAHDMYEKFQNDMRIYNSGTMISYPLKPMEPMESESKVKLWACKLGNNLAHDNKFINTIFFRTNIVSEVLPFLKAKDIGQLNKTCKATQINLLYYTDDCGRNALIKDTALTQAVQKHQGIFHLSSNNDNLMYVDYHEYNHLNDVVDTIGNNAEHDVELA